MTKKKMKFVSETILAKYPQLEIEIDGKAFKVASHLPMAMLSGATKEEIEQGGSEVLIKHLATLLDCDSAEIAELNLDVRVFRHILEVVQEMVTEQIQTVAKNPMEAETSSPK